MDRALERVANLLLRSLKNILEGVIDSSAAWGHTQEKTSKSTAFVPAGSVYAAVLGVLGPNPGLLHTKPI